MSRDQGPIVVETGYVTTHQGPAEDTESFTRDLDRTPAPGERMFVERTRSVGDEHTLDDTGWIQRTSSEGKSGYSSSITPQRAILVIGALLIGAFSITTGGILVLLGTGQVGDPTPVVVEPMPDEPTPDADDPTWQGLKVKKGLR